MKRLIYIAIGIVVFFTGCERSPHADFTLSKSVVGVGENVYFYNHSDYAKDFEWDFGDGNFSYASEPVYSYVAPGIYEIQLAAFDDNEASYAYRNIEVVGLVADFSVSSYVVEAGEPVTFYNESEYATGYIWDFDDGTVSTAVDVEHIFVEPGLYDVQLTATDGNWEETVTATIEVVGPTVLSIEVLEFYDKYPVEGASILIYPSYNDWVNETNAITEVFSDEHGIAEVAGLEPSTYYLDIWHESHDNYALADEDINFIKVTGMEANAINYFTAWVDYFERPLRSGSERVRRKSANEVKRKYDASRK